MKCKAILWDVGGTLVGDGVAPAVSIRQRLDRCDFDHRSISDEHILSTLSDFLKNERTWQTIDDERRDREIWVQKLTAGIELFDDQLHAIERSLVAYYDVHAPVPGIVELIDELDQRGIKQAIVSNWPPSLPQFLSHHGFDHCFETVCFSAEDGIHKPDERIFRRAMLALNVLPQETVMIGDNPDWDIHPTRAMGMKAIHFDPRKLHASREAEDVATLRRMLWEMIDAQ